MVKEERKIWEGRKGNKGKEEREIGEGGEGNKWKEGREISGRRREK